MGRLWKVKSARVKGENLVIVAEKEIPLHKILDNTVLEETSKEDDEEGMPEEEEKLVGVIEKAEKLQDKIEEAEMETGSPGGKLKGQKGRVLASVDNGNLTLAEIAEDTKIPVPSSSHQISWLAKNGFVKRVERGRYEMTAKGKTYLKKMEEADV